LSKREKFILIQYLVTSGTLDSHGGEYDGGDDDDDDDDDLLGCGAV
jgi:hypothetical protein